MRGRPWTAPPGAPADLNPPSALPEWAVVMGGSWGARPAYCSGAPPCAAPCALLRRAGVGLPVGRDPRGSRRRGALGRAVCRFSRTPPPRVAVPSGGGGAPPRLRGGGGSLLWLPSWGGGAGRGGLGGPPPRPPTPVGRRPAIRCLGRAPPGIYSCRGGCRAAAGVRRGPVGRQRVSAVVGGEEGGGTFPPWFAPPSSPGWPL